MNNHKNKSKVIKKKIFPFSDTHLYVIDQHLNYKINILQGAVRSGKSYITNFLFLSRLEGKSGDVVLSGFTSNTIKKNVVSDLQNILNVEFKFNKNSFGEYFVINLPKFKRLKFFCVGAGKDRDEKKVQGMTVIGWLADEVATYNQKFFDMMLTRLSNEDSFAYMTLNPEAPNHWLKTFIDEQTNENSTKFIKGFVKSYSFKLDDNLSLSEDYKNQIKNSLSGVLYRRLVLGEWAVGEGLIYSIDKLIKKSPFEIEKELLNNKLSISEKIGVDLGTSHPSAFIYIKKVGNKFYALDEYYKAKIAPSELSKDLNEFHKKYNKSKINYDHAALWFFEQMKKDYPNLTLNKAKKDVNKGIAYIEMLILNGLLVVSTKCVNLIKELESYSWDTKKEGEVIKVGDDAVDALRYGIFTDEYSSSFY